MASTRTLQPLLLLAALAAAIATGAAQGAPLLGTFSGSAYAIDSDQLLFRETHFAYPGVRGGEGLVLYRCADGRPFARKRSHDDGDAQTPDFDLVDARSGYREGVRERDGAREVYVQRSREKPEQSAPLRPPADAVIDTGFDAFVQRHWSELVRGDALRFDFLVPSRRTFFAFQAAKVANPAATPPGAVTFRLSSATWFAFLLPHIDVSYDQATRQPVRYEGLSNVRDDNGKNYRVRFEYAKIAVRNDVAPDEIDAAMTQPLVSSCTAADNSASATGQSTVPEVTTSALARNPNR